MANRYWVGGSGDWSDASHWSTSSGGSGGASLPTSSDSVFIDGSSSNPTITVSSDISVSRISITDNVIYIGGGGPPVGTINFGNFNHSIGLLQGFSRSTIILGSGVLTISRMNITIGASFNAGTATIIIDTISGYSSRTINVATDSWIENLIVEQTSMIDSLKARTAIINANTSLSIGPVQFAKLVINNSNLTSTSTGVQRSILIANSNQLVAADADTIRDISINGAGMYYAGDGSTDSGNNTGWIFSDAPKVETLVDNFSANAVNTTRWTAIGTIAQYGGWIGTSSFGSTRTGTLVSKDQWLAEGSYMKFKQVIDAGNTLTAYFTYASQQYGVTARRNIPDIYVTLTATTGQFFIKAATNYTSVAFSNDYLYYRIRESNGTIYLDGSTDGIVFTNVKSAVAANYGLDTTQLIARPYFDFTANGVSSVNIGAFNVDLEPTAEFTATPVSGTTPLTVNFTDQSNFAPTTWSWNFGDGTTNTAQNPSKTYSVPGTYSVSLTAVKGATTRTTTKSNLITASPNVYTRSVSGTITFGGSLSRKILASRSISGGLVFGGGVRAVVLRDVEGLQDKRYLYKVYDPDGNYVEVWKDVISELNFTHEINTIGSTTTVELARNSDTLGTTTAPLLTEDGQNLLTEDDFDILVSTQSRNQVGSGSSVDYSNRVDIIVFYGSVGPLLTENDEPLLTEDDEELLADVGAPNGRRIFTGFISEINSRYGNTETTIVQLTSYGWDLDQFPITTSGGATTVPFNSYDPSNIASEAIDKFITDSASYGTYTTRTDSSISPTGTVVSYTFRANTYGDVLDKTLELMPSNWYYRVGLGDNTVYYRERSSTPHHLFYLGKHIKAMDLKGSIMESTNRVLFTGGGDPALFINREEVPADRVRRRLEIISDSRVTLTDSAEIISDGRIDQNNKQLFRTTVEILAVQYDIESIDVGQTVGFRNFGDSYVDGLVMQVVGLSYNPSSVQLQLETKPPTINKRLEDLRRNLTITENTNIPDTPS